VTAARRALPHCRVRRLGFCSFQGQGALGLFVLGLEGLGLVHSRVRGSGSGKAKKTNKSPNPTPKP
jgi:hypothetical protein